MTPSRKPSGDPSGDPAGGLDAPILAILRKDRRPHTPEELSEQTGMPLTGVKRALGKLVHERQVRKAGGGKFAAAAKPGHR